MTKKSIIILTVSLVLVAFLGLEFRGCLVHSMPYEAYMHEREFVISKVDMYPHTFALYDETGYRFYIRDRDTQEIFMRLDSTLVNKKVKVSYTDWTSAFTSITRNSRACKLQVGDSVCFDIIIPAAEE